jgi:methyl-accepting chemotaxis protein
MDGVTQSNAAQVEELSGTSQSLASQAEQLQALVSHFTFKPDAVKRNAASTAAAKTPHASPAVTSGSTAVAEPASKSRNVQYLKPRVVAQKSSAAGGDWTEF